jgi:hypothetical protein
LRAGEIQSSSAGTEFILECAFSTLEDDSLFEAAVDFIDDLIHETQEIQENMPVIQLLLSMRLCLELMNKEEIELENVDLMVRLRSFNSPDFIEFIKPAFRDPRGTN